jgi:hypothetical protein
MSMRLELRFSTIAFLAACAASGCAREITTTDAGVGTGGGSIDANPVIISVETPRPRTGTWSVNYWTWPQTYGNSVAGTESLIAALKPTWMRVGGYNNDANTPDPFDDAEMDRMIAYARAIGAEPILQVPLLQDTNGQHPTGDTAAAMVTYANITKGYRVQYFSIGNEPDLYAMQGDPINAMQPARPGYTPVDYCATARDFVTKMKAADPSIKIIGPDLAYQYQPSGSVNWLTPILTSCGDLFDVIAVHRYPFSAPQATLPAARADVAAFRNVMSQVRGLVDAAGFADKPLALTEMNIAYDATPAGTSPAAAPGTVPSALWLADVLGVALDIGLWTTAQWDISDPDQWGLGFLTLPPAHTPRPEYYAYQLYADHYGPTLADVTAAPSGIGAHATRNAAGNATDVIVVNWNSSPLALSFQVTGLATAPPPAIFELPALSMAAVEIPDVGAPAAWAYGDAQRQTGVGPQPLTPGVVTRRDGGSGGGETDAGLDVGIAGPDVAVRKCNKVVVSTPAITTLGRATGAVLTFGAGASQWGSFTYSGNGQPLPTASVSADGNGIDIAATFVAPVAPTNNYAGVGLYYSSASCIDATSYSGIAFDFSGDLGACSLRLGVSFSDVVAVVNDPVRGTCMAGASCYGPSAAVVPGPSRIQVPFAALAGGMPVDRIDPTTIINVAWELSAPLGSPGSCSATFTVSNAAFY